MQTANSWGLLLRVGLLAATAGGCGTPTIGPLPQTPEQESVAQLGRVLAGYRGKPAPKALKEMLSREQGSPAAIGALRSGDLPPYRGVGLSDVPEAAGTVVAYRKGVPEAGARS